MTQEELGAAIGVGKSVMSRIESGHRAIKTTELADLADALGVSMRDLVGVRKPSPPLAIAHRLDEASADSGSARQARSHFRNLLELEGLLDELEIPHPPRRSQPFSPPTPASLNPVTAGTEMANEMRDSMGLGLAPVTDLASTIETEMSVPVSGFGLGKGSDVVSGASVVAGTFTSILVNTSKWPTHQRFTLAHELGHLLFHDPVDIFQSETADEFRETNDREVRANAFAAAFLMPAAAVDHSMTRTGRITEFEFADILFRYRVSIPMLAWKLFNLEVFTAAARDEAMGWSPQTLARRHNRMDDYLDQANDVDVTRPPTDLHERTMRAYTSGVIGIGPLAGLLGRDREELRNELDEEGLSPTFDDDGSDLLATV